MDFIGWAGGICLALCGAPLAYRAWKDKFIDIDKPFLFLWTLGEILTLAYVLGNWPLVFNYSINLLCLGVVWRYVK